MPKINQKGISSVIIILLTVLIGGAIYGAYYFGKTNQAKNSDLDKTATNNTTVTDNSNNLYDNGNRRDNPTKENIEPLPSPPETKEFVSAKCTFKVQAPNDWIVKNKPTSDFISLGVTNHCLEISAPDFKESGLTINIQRILIGSKANAINDQSPVINNLNDFLKIIGTITPPTNVGNKQIGVLNGKSFELNLGEGTQNYIFNDEKYIYHVYWPLGYEGELKDQIEPIIKSFSF